MFYIKISGTKISLDQFSTSKSEVFNIKLDLDEVSISVPISIEFDIQISFRFQILFLSIFDMSISLDHFFDIKTNFYPVST